MDPVWLVRSRQVAARFRFWLALFGYNPRDRSLSHRIYLVYAAIFYTLWGFAVLSLAAGGTGRFLDLLRLALSYPGGREDAVLGTVARDVSSLGLAGLGVIACWAASRRSPLRFSEDDAYLICQTPVDRRRVALAWLFGQWVESAPFVGAAAVVLGFGLMEAGSPQGLSGEDLPGYLLFGGRSLAIFLPLHLGLTALAWALGVLRLQGDRHRPRLSLVPLGLGLLLVVALLSAGAGGLGGVPGGLPAADSAGAWLLMPLTFPLGSAFGLSPWVVGLAFALGVALAGLLLLAWVSPRLNLSRAALESRGIVARENAILTGNLAQAEELDRRERLGISRRPSAWLSSRRWERQAKLPAGSLALLLKDRAQAVRTIRLRDLFLWLGLFSLSLGVLAIGEPGMRIFSLFLWINLLQAQATKRLQADLRLWGLLRQVPVTGGQLVVADAAAPLLLACLLSWAALLAASGFGALPSNPSALLLMTPVLAVNVALSGALDVLRQSKSANLLAGNAPQPGMLGLAISGALVGVGWFFLIRFSEFGALMSLPVLLIASRLLYTACDRRLRTIR